jgi:hypothetical protein
VIPFISICFAAYEAFAITCNRPTITKLSRRRPEGILIWAWLLMLTLHFAHDD